MKAFFFTMLAYLRYLSKSGSRHSVHSPFVYSIVNEVFKNNKAHASFADIAKLRSKLLRSNQLIETTDFGKGKNLKDFVLRYEDVASVARKSAVSEKYGRLLFRLVEYFNPQTIVELGTSLGISTLYLALAAPKAKVFTIEGCTTKAEKASSNFDAMGVSNIVQHIGRFDLVLPDLVKQAGKLDFAFIDGNHTCEATLANFNSLLEIAHNDTVLVFDDIHWSPGMEKAWDAIVSDERVTVSIDLFRMGIVFLKRELSKQKFIIRF